MSLYIYLPRSSGVILSKWKLDHATPLFKAFNGLKYLSKIQNLYTSPLNLISEMFLLSLSCSHTSHFVLYQTCQAQCCLEGLCLSCPHSLECSSIPFRSLLNSQLRTQAFSDHTSLPPSLAFPHTVLFCSADKVPSYTSYIYLTLSQFSRTECVPQENRKIIGYRHGYIASNCQHMVATQ